MKIIRLENNNGSYSQLYEQVRGNNVAPGDLIQWDGGRREVVLTGFGMPRRRNSFLTATMAGKRPSCTRYLMKDQSKVTVAHPGLEPTQEAIEKLVLRGMLKISGGGNA